MITLKCTKREKRSSRLCFKCPIHLFLKVGMIKAASSQFFCSLQWAKGSTLYCSDSSQFYFYFSPLPLCLLLYVKLSSDWHKARILSSDWSLCVLFPLRESDPSSAWPRLARGKSADTRYLGHSDSQSLSLIFQTQNISQCFFAIIFTNFIIFRSLYDDVLRWKDAALLLSRLFKSS